MPVVFATAKEIARIELNEEEAKRIDSIEPETFIDIPNFPFGVKLKIAETETLTPTARELVKEGVLEVSATREE